MKYFILFLLIVGLNASSTYVGKKSCITCHKDEHNSWLGSHHDSAMKKPTPKTIIGDFNNATLSLNGVTSSFYKKGLKYFIKTDGKDGKLHEYEVAYTFGIYPLQQYLLKFPNGVYQVPEISWDARSKEDGGQRWFHIHEDEVIKSDNAIHWTTENFNWNYMCADCHSTNLRKNYNPKTKSYNTTYSSINVSCEACHGPASEHLKWADNPKKFDKMKNKGLTINLSSFTKQRWKMDEHKKPVFLADVIDTTEIEMCAKCHSRRVQLDDDYVAGDRLYDHYLPLVLEKNLYYSDGKIKDEVYVIGSFKQSKMYEAGVTCSDCHDSHSLHRKGVGDSVCFSCHDSVTYMSKKHHFHEEGSQSASCITCHMPSRTYMGVDERNDHSFRVPRPDIADELGMPDACTSCHKDKKASWASEIMKKWYKKTPKGYQNFAHNLKNIEVNSDKAVDSIYKILMSDEPNIAKATAISYMGSYPSKQTYTTILQMLDNPDVMIRLEAVRALESFPPQVKVKPLFGVLDKDDKAVRMEAMRILSLMPLDDSQYVDKKLYDKNFKEYKKVLRYNSDKAQSQVAIANIYATLGDMKQASIAYKEAIRLEPHLMSAYVNYAEFLKRNNQDKEGLEMLNQALKVDSNSALIYYVKGLYYVRNKLSEIALVELKKAYKLEKENATYAYAYAISLYPVDNTKAINVLENTLKINSGDIQILYALSHYYREKDDSKKAQYYLDKANRLSHFVPNLD